MQWDGRMINTRVPRVVRHAGGRTRIGREYEQTVAAVQQLLSPGPLRGLFLSNFVPGLQSDRVSSVPCTSMKGTPKMITAGLQERDGTPVASSLRRRAIRSAMVVSTLVLMQFPWSSAVAQATLGEMRRQATRAELEAAAEAAESAVQRAPDEKVRRVYQETAATYRQRLQNGDFIPGDRILLEVIGDSLLSDTFTVRSDRKLPLPNLPDVSLHGVLDSELESHLTKELSKYLRVVELSATVLLRISVLGAVGRQDFITVPVDQALTDVISSAGGFAGGTPDFKKSTIRRGDKVFLDGRGVQEAFQKGKTVGDLSMRDGDVLYIPAVTQGSSRWQQVTIVLGALGSVAWVVRTLAR